MRALSLSLSLSGPPSPGDLGWVTSLIPQRGPLTPRSLLETKELIQEEGKGGQLGLAQPGKWQQIFMELGSVPGTVPGVAR